MVHPARMARALRTLWNRGGFQRREVVLILPSALCELRTLRLPNVPERERRALVRGELEHAGVLPPGEGYFGFAWSEPTPTPGALADAYAFCATASAIEPMRDALRDAGLILAGAEPISIAAMRAYLGSCRQRGAVALLFPEEFHSDLCIHDGRVLRQLRRIPAGRMGAVESGPPKPGARPAPRYALGSASVGETGAPPGPESGPGWGLPGKGDAAALSTAAPSRAEWHPAPAHSFLATEIARSLAYTAREFEDEPQPEALVVVADAVTARDFASALEGALRIPVRAGAGLAAFDLPRATHLGDAAVSEWGYYAAIGGALGPDAGLPRLDLCAGMRPQRAQFSRTDRRLLTAAGVMLACGLAVTGTLRWREAALVREHAALRLELARVQEARSPQARYMELQRLTDAVSGGWSPAAAVLGRVAAAWSEDLELSTLTLGADGALVLEGRATGTAALHRFMARLSSGDLLGTPRLEGVTRDAEDRLRFRITMPGTARTRSTRQ